MLQSAHDKAALAHLVVSCLSSSSTKRVPSKVEDLAWLEWPGCLGALQGDASWQVQEACDCWSHAPAGLLAGSEQEMGTVAQSASSGRDLNSCRCQTGATPGHSRCQRRIEGWSKCCLAGASMERQ